MATEIFPTKEAAVIIREAKSTHVRPKNKEARLSIRASEPEKSILQQAARTRHLNTSQFILQVSLDAAKSILVDQTTFTLPPDQWNAFCERLDAPPRAKPELQRLLSRPEPFDG